jgi:pyrimidine operon attenuation protein / uracil phosphoribosyltransferase
MSLAISDDLFKDKVVILVDDVLNSGKTLMYASKLFLNTNLKKLSILVLIDRNHNLFPIKADFVGLSLSTSLKEYITVDLAGDNKGVYLS